MNIYSRSSSTGRLPEQANTPAEVEEAIRRLSREVNRKYLRKRLARLLGLKQRTADTARDKYDQIAGQYRQTEDALSSDDMELVMVGGTPHLMPAAEFLDHHRRYLAQVLSEAGGNSLMEVGAGELNTLLPVLALLPSRPEEVIALDISEARLKAGQPYDKAGHVTKYITASAADIPLPDKSVDVIFTNHCLEQSPKLVAPALREFARVCRKRIILTEPAYELAHPLQRKRIRKLGYVRGIPSTARRLGLNVVSHELLPVRRYRNGSAMTIIDI